MKVKFWGVRGSIPSPGLSTSRYGGNTSCVSIELDGDKVLILDAGTGIRELGKAMVSKDTDIFVLLSHIHWDHIQGLPFFMPLYQPNRTIYLFPFHVGGIFSCLTELMDGVHFPVTCVDLPSHCHNIENGMAFLSERGVNVSRIAINHRGGGYGYRIEDEGCSVAYLTDNELAAPRDIRTTGFNKFVQFCRNTDVLIHDAQYVEEDMPQKRGWGHSLASQACELALAAEVKHLILFHHDPDRTDDELDSMQGRARSWFERNNHPIQCTVVFEGLSLAIENKIRRKIWFPDCGNSSCGPLSRDIQRNTIRYKWEEAGAKSVGSLSQRSSFKVNS